MEARMTNAWRRFAERLGVDHPLVLAPLAGGPSTPALAAAVSNAGGLGSLGAAYLAPDEIRAAVAETRRMTDRPFAVNLFAGGATAGADDPGPMLELLARWHAALGMEPPGIPALPADGFDAQLEAVWTRAPASSASPSASRRAR
jgi:nitronate monooxygenase